MIDPQLAGKVAIVTGANHGIGAATARALARQSVKVFVHYFQVPSQFDAEQRAQALQRQEKGAALYQALQQTAGERVAEQIVRDGGEAAAWHADLGDAANIERMFAHCEQTLGACDILVANHTHCVLHTFDPARVSTEQLGVSLLEEGEIDRHFQINTRAVALMMRCYVERYFQRAASWGRIINISTDAASAHVENVSYAASKYAIESYTFSAAAELGRYGITVNAVAPGPIQTGYMPQAIEDQIAARIPLGRIGEPQDVADAVVFLASKQGRWLTGQRLNVGGGWKMDL